MIIFRYRKPVDVPEQGEPKHRSRHLDHHVTFTHDPLYERGVLLISSNLTLKGLIHHYPLWYLISIWEYEEIHPRKSWTAVTKDALW